MSPTTHFARCVSATKTTAKGFWAWWPAAAKWPRTRRSAPAPLPTTVENHYARIVAAAGRAQRLRSSARIGKAGGEHDTSLV